MNWLTTVGMALLGIGVGVSYIQHVTIGLGIFAVGVVLTTYGFREKAKGVTAKA